MKLVTLEPDPRLRRLGRIVAVTGVLVLSAATVPLLRLQLGELGWRILRDESGAAFWPLGGLAAAGAALLLAYALWLRHRPVLSPLLVLIPAALAGVGTGLGLWRLPGPDATGAAGLTATAASLTSMAWSLALGAVLAAGGALVLGALTLRRARALGTPWRPLLVAIFALVIINAFSQVARLPARPFTAVVIAAAMLGPLLIASLWATDAPPAADSREAAVVPVALLLALLAALAAAGSESLVLRAAALYAQGPGAEAHAESLALGGAHSTTVRLASGALLVVGTLAVLILVAAPLRDELRPHSRAGSVGLAVALLLGAAALAAFAVHRYQLGQTVARIQRADRPATTAALGSPPAPTATATIGSPPASTTTATIGSFPASTTTAAFGSPPASTTTAAFGSPPASTTTATIGSPPAPPQADPMAPPHRASLTAFAPGKRPHPSFESRPPLEAARHRGPRSHGGARWVTVPVPRGNEIARNGEWAFFLAAARSPDDWG